MTRWSLFLQTLSLLHHFLGLYWIEHAEGITPIPLQRLLDEGIVEWYPGHGSPPSEYKGVGPIPYIRVSDVVNWELYRNPTTGVPRHVYERIKGRKGVSLQEGDIVFVRRGSYRIGTVAMASPFDGEVLLTREFVVLRVVQPINDYGIDQHYLIYLLSHQFTQDQIEQKVFIDTTLPNISERWKELYCRYLLMPMNANAPVTASRVSLMRNGRL